MSAQAMGQRTGLRLMPGPRVDAAGLAAGTVVMTADGALLVDFLEPGDQIITRSGMRVLREIHCNRYSGPAIRIREGALCHGRPDQALVLPAHAPVLVRDWRATALCGRKSAVMEVDRLVDGEFIVPTEAISMRLFDLRFDHPEIVYAEGLEIACAAAEKSAQVAAE
jgi:Hint domain